MTRYEDEEVGDNPLSIAFVKSYLKIDTDDDDLILQAIIDSVVSFAEAMTHRSLRMKTILAYPESFCDKLELRRKDVESIVDIKYIYGGTEYLLDEASYWLKRETISSYLMLSDGHTWPNIDREDSIQIRFTVSADAKLPQISIQMLKQIANLYENRGDDIISPESNANDINWYRNFQLPNF